MEDTAPPPHPADLLKDHFRGRNILSSQDIQALAQALGQAANRTDPPSSDPDQARDLLRNRAEAALLLRRLAEQSDARQDVQACLACMAAMDRPGLLAACRYIREKHFSLAELTPMFLSLPGPDQTALLSELLRRPHLESKDTLAWAKSLLPELAAASPPEMADGLARLARQGEELAFPVRQTLLSGPLGSWIKGILTTRAKPDLLVRAALALALLQDQDTVQALARVVSEQRPRPSHELLESLVRLRGMAPRHMTKAVRALLLDAEPEDAPDCLMALARLRWNRVGKAARLMANMTRAVHAAVCRRSVLLPEDQYRAFMSGFGPDEKPFALAYAFAGAATADPDCLRLCLDTIQVDEILGRQDLANLDAYLNQAQAAHPSFSPALNADQAPVPEPPEGPTHPDKRTGLFGRLFGKRRPGLDELLAASAGHQNLELPGAELRGAAYAGRTLAGGNLSGAYFETVRFERCAFTGTDLSQAGLKDCEFTDCSFANCDLAGLRLHACAFTGCTFTDCDLSWSVWADCVLAQCRVDSCLLSKSLVHACTLERTVLSHTVLAGAAMQNGILRSSRMVACDLSGAGLLSCHLAGTELVDCVLAGTALAQCVFLSSRMDGCTLANILQRRNDGPVAPLVADRWEAACRRLCGDMAEPLPPPPAGLARGKGLRVLQRALDLWVRWMGMTRQEAAMLTSNQRRLDMSLRRMRGSEFFRLAPHLLATDLYERKAGWNAVSPAVVRGFHPDLATLELAEARFDHSPPDGPDGRGDRLQSDSVPVIQALYTMGSVGTIAQTRDSDVDYWVCYDPAETTPDQIRLLRRKLDGLSAWALETWGLEAYFFLMSVDRVRANDFGFSDRESSGSAQALLLKDEFYRSMLVVAGLEPVWWVTPPGADEEDYQDRLPQALDYPMHGEPRLMDLGRPSPVPAEEFFGASLWQIVKSLHNPYKSVLKLGLLEKYAGATDGLLLCDRIKDNLLQGMTEVADADPYGLLFKELRRYYSSVGDKDAVKLLTECLMLKAGVARYDLGLGFAAWPEEKGFLDFLLGPDANAVDRMLALARPWSFVRSMKIGATVRRFMTGAYKRIRAERRQGSAKGSTAITPEDMTRMGRQVAANFAVREHKVEHTPFLGAGRRMFPELYFAAQKAPGRTPLWQAFGKTGSEIKVPTKDMQLLRAGRDPVMLLAWLVTNKLYEPGGLVHADRSIAPLSVAEIRAIMTGLMEFLRPGDMDYIEPEEYLKMERVVRAYFVINLTTAPDVKRVALAHVVYTTNWGEVFCRRFADPPPGLTRRASAFLKANLAQKVSPGVVMKAYFPKRSQVTRFTLT